MADYELHHMDGQELVARLIATGGEYAVVTDPPYGIGESGRKNASRSNKAKALDYGDYNWDTERLKRADVQRLVQLGQPCVIWGGQYYANVLPMSSAWIVWDKLNTGDFADCELAWTSTGGAVRKFTWMWNGFIKQAPEKRYHPTQKPLALMKWVLTNYVPKGMTVVDPYMGSGTTGVACMELGYGFIGADVSEAYCEIARERIEAQRQKPTLFEALGQPTQCKF